MGNIDLKPETKKQYPWYIVHTILFFLINSVMLWFVKEKNFSSLIEPFNFILLGLASYRMADIISNERVTRPIRSFFTVQKEKNGHWFEEPRKEGLKGSIGALIYCPSCTGVWVGALLSYSFLLFPQTVKIILLIFSASAMERIFSSLIGFMNKKE